MKDENVEWLNALSGKVIGAAIEVHRELGPGLLEGIYQEALAVEMMASGLAVAREVDVPVSYKGHRLQKTLRLDLLVENSLIVEVKSVDQLVAIHGAQLLSYLRLAAKPLGLLLNFNVETLRQGVKRVVNGF